MREKNAGGVFLGAVYIYFGVSQAELVQGETSSAEQCLLPALSSLEGWGHVKVFLFAPALRITLRNTEAGTCWDRDAILSTRKCQRDRKGTDAYRIRKQRAKVGTGA